MNKKSIFFWTKMNQIKNEVKVKILQKGHTMTKLVELLNGKYNKNTTVQNLSNKLTRETIQYKEILEIADVLGYEIRWVDKENK